MGGLAPHAVAGLAAGFMKILPRVVPVGCVMFLSVVAAFAQNRTFTSQYSFGDSLSDSGNLYLATSRTQPPSPPYFQGRFSNGPTFVEQLGQTMIPSVSVSARGPNRNFAFGGANAGAGGAVPNLALQIGAYTQQGNPAAPTDLFTVWAGANDLIGVLSSPTTPFNPSAIDAAGAAAAQAAVAGVQSLVGLGAKNIVVLGLPNLGATPRSLAAGGPGGPGATFGLRATNAFNNELVARLRTLSAAAPDVNLVYLDPAVALESVFRDPARFGFTNTTSYVLAPSAAGANTEGYVYFDDIHPTTKTHALLASLVTEMLNPEPMVGFASTVGSSALVLTGIGSRAIDARTSQLAVTNRATGRGEAYAEFNYADGNRSADGWQPEFDFTGRVLSAGVDYRLSDGVFIGGAVDAGRLSTTTAGGGRFQVENGTGRVYMVWRGGPVSLVVDGDYGSLSVQDIRRGSALGGLQSVAEAGGEHWGAGIKFAWALDTGRVVLRPWAGLRTERVSLDPYIENDIATLGLAYARQKARSSSAALGLDFSSNTKLGSHPARFDLRAAWHGEVGSRQRAVAGQLANNFTTPTLLNLEDGDGSGFELGGAVTVWVSTRWSTSLGYSGDIRSSDDLTSRLTFSIQTGF
jgi:outer membrane lipase/esterase